MAYIRNVLSQWRDNFILFFFFNFFFCTNIFKHNWLLLCGEVKENYPYHVYVTGTTAFNWLTNDDKTWYHFSRNQSEIFIRVEEKERIWVNYPFGKDMRPIRWANSSFRSCKFHKENRTIYLHRGDSVLWKITILLVYNFQTN